MARLGLRPGRRANPLPEEFPRHRDLRHLEDDVAGVVDDLGADVDELAA